MPTQPESRYHLALHTHVRIRRVTKNWALVDPPLTEIGVQQAKDLETQLRDNVPIASQVGLIVVSPFSRTIQTALHGLGWLIKGGIPVQLDAYWQENSEHNCDRPVSKEYLSQQYPNLSFPEEPPGYTDKKGPFAFTQTAIEARGRHVRQWLKNRPEKVVAVVSHSAFLRLGASGDVKWRYANADYRIFDFMDDDASDQIVQWSETRDRGGGMGRSEIEQQAVRPWDFKNAVEPDTLEDKAGKRETVAENPVS